MPSCSTGYGARSITFHLPLQLPQVQNAPVEALANPSRPGGSVTDDEKTLLDGLRAGEPKSYEDLVRVYGGRMLAAARRLLRNEEEARDCVQEAFLHAFRSIHTFDGRAALRTWLHRITINAALMKIRARQGQPIAYLDELMPEFDADGCRIEPEQRLALPIETLLQRRHVRTLVREAIDRLPDAYRTVLILRDIEELDTEETARLLDTTPGAIKARLHRARAALKKLLEPVLSGAD